ncbi:hypothetical protein N7492_004008 [Penicillium capsulatum]|uniref:Uncharacterized protein n=1 Tax=Penicillium capsulatum TaxID=69766 RepID=A0A9W9IMD0_9EURO|nr:hypothetical protein N7492_004008 [Penicillium capsulatum]KAJ6121416.1 hypothetical protein N7512_003881 [Penicillium capsulatum]
MDDGITIQHMVRQFRSIPRDRVDRAHSLGQPARDANIAGQQESNKKQGRLEQELRIPEGFGGAREWRRPQYDGNTLEAVGVAKP